MHLHFILLLLFFLTLSTASPAAEPQREETLRPVVVTPTRTDIPQEETTTSVSVITAEEIREQQAETVLGVLRNVPGVDVAQSGSRGATTSVFIRGSNSDQVLVLMDGVEVNSTTLGSFDFAHLATDNIERIEVVRGAGGSLYGSKAVGGVINIITKKGSGPLHATLSAEGGNGTTHREVAAISGSTGGLNYSLSSTYLRTTGFNKVNDDYRNAAVSARFDYELMKDGSLSAIFNMTDSKLGLVNNNVSSNILDPNARENDQRFTGQLAWRHKVLPQWDYRLSLGITQAHERFSDPDPIIFGVCGDPFTFALPSRTLIKPRILAPQFQTNYRFDPGHQVTFGVDLDLRSAELTSTDGCNAVTSFDKSQNNQAVYLQDQLKLFDERLILVGGVRYDNNQDFGPEWSPSFSTAYLLKETGTKFKAGYAEGFRAPTFNDLFFPGFGNPGLRPETTWEINAGVEQRLWRDRLQVEVIYFHREARDLIVFRGLRPENVGQVIFDGAELILRAKLGYGFAFNGNYTYVNFSDRLVRRPKHKGNVTLSYQEGPFHASLNSHITGRRLDVDAVTFATVDKGGFARFDLVSSYALPLRLPGVKQVSVIGKIENLFDKKYEEADGFRARPFNFLIGIRGVFGKE